MAKEMQIGNGEFWQGDCLDLMADIPDGSVDMVVTDPPYRVISGGKNSHYPDGNILHKNDGKIFKHNDIDIYEWLPETYRVLKPDSHIYIMTNLLNLSEFMTEVKKGGFYIHNLLVWEKNNSTPNRWYMKNCEYVIFAKKGKAKTINKPNSKTVHKFPQDKDRFHPTQKPESLISHYIDNSSNPGDLVLDPFAGSGTTAIAAERTGRRWICIEQDAEYYSKATARIQDELRQGKLL